MGRGGVVLGGLRGLGFAGDRKTSVWQLCGNQRPKACHTHTEENVGWPGKSGCSPGGHILSTGACIPILTGTTTSCVPGLFTDVRGFGIIKGRQRNALDPWVVS